MGNAVKIVDDFVSILKIIHCLGVFRIRFMRSDGPTRQWCNNMETN